MNSNHQTAPLWSQEDWKREFAEIFFARRGIIFATAFLIFIAALWIALFWPPTYEASSSILVRGKKPQISPAMLERLEVRASPVAEEDIYSEIQILTSNELIRRTLVAMYGQDGGDAGENRQFPFLNGGGLIEAIKHVKANLHIEVAPSSNVIIATYQDQDAARAERILDTLLAQYISYRAEIFSPSEEADFLKDRADYYRRQLYDKENEILQLARRGNVALIRQEMENSNLMRKDLEQRLVETRFEHQRQVSSLATLQEALEREGVQLFAFLQNDSMDRLGGQLALLVEKREDAARHYLPTAANIKALDEQIAQVYDLLRYEAGQILAERLNSVGSLASGIEQLEERIAALTARNIVLQGSLIEQNRLDREISMLENAYETYSRRSEEAQISFAIAAANTSGDVSILAGAGMSARRAFPRPLQTVLLGLLAGIVAGMSLGFLAEYLDHTVKRPSEVHRHIGLPVICSIRKAR